MVPQPSEATLLVGIDIAAKTATMIRTTNGKTCSRPLTVDQTPHGYAQLHTVLQTTGHTPQMTRIGMEATGTYWMTLALTLVDFGYAVSVINPRQAHNFAKVKRAKTDPVDAHTLAILAAWLHPTPWVPPPPVPTELQQRFTQRD